MWTSEEQKRRRIYFVAVSIVIILLHLMGLVSATSRTFTSNDEAHHQQAGQNSESVSPTPSSSQQHKCGGCVPCEAIQVPTTTDRVGIQYANYEPEGWKYKCRTTFFNP
ncbi:hypothetical protein MKX01_003840 [Papaver californicum]|nr:hypothetical protein MKX01_003840 [Papaver californicum]